MKNMECHQIFAWSEETGVNYVSVVFFCFHISIVNNIFFSKIYVFIKNLKEIMSAYNAMFFKFLKVEIHDKIHLRFT